MDNQRLMEWISGLVPEAIPEENTPFPSCVVPAESLRKLAAGLKTEPSLAFDYLFNLSGVDWGVELGVVYHLTSTVHRHTVQIKVKLSDREHPAVDTVSDLWLAADFYEREAYDMFGIRFTGHTDMRRIFLDEEWVGYPMRKDYRDNVNIIEL
jgi:NADH-quinone oxidoreductase subunit C